MSQIETPRDPIDNIAELFGLTRLAAREVLERTKAKEGKQHVQVIDPEQGTSVQTTG